MDSKSVLRGTVAAAIAVTVAGAGIGAAWAGAPVRPDRHLGVWKMRVTPNAQKIRQAPTKARNKAYAFRMVSRRAWSGEQFQCLDSLWTRESNWNHRAHNQGSGAYGIPQALPGAKMGYVARDWRFNPQTQIKWGLRYIKGRYGSPCGAWGHYQSHNWY